MSTSCFSESISFVLASVLTEIESTRPPRIKTFWLTVLNESFCFSRRSLILSKVFINESPTLGDKEILMLSDETSSLVGFGGIIERVNSARLFSEDSEEISDE